METKYVGWQIGINYQTPQPEGIDFNYLKNVIDRSADSGMNFIGLLMASHAYFCPEHDGYAWPVKNPRLKPLKDNKCLNANIKSEFVRKTLDYARRKGFHCQLMIGSMFWNPARVVVNYPQATSQCYADGAKVDDGWMFCPDSPGGWQLAVDEVTDLLEFYSDSPVDSFMFERLSYSDEGTCFCKYSREKFKDDTGDELGKSRLTHLIWKGNCMKQYLTRYINHIHDIKSEIDVWIHTGGEPGWGHFPHVLSDVGVEVISNHGQHFLPNKKLFHQQLDWLAPLPCVPHICVRDMPTHNYPVPIKTPEMICDYASWLEDYPSDRVIGAMFFNEVRTTEQNKSTVYKIVKRWKKNG